MKEKVIEISFDQFRNRGCPGEDCQHKHSECVAVVIFGTPWIEQGDAVAGISCRGCGTEFNVRITAEAELEALFGLMLPES